MAAPAAPDVTRLSLPDGPATVDAGLRQASGKVSIVVRLADAPLALANGENAKISGAKLSKGQQQQHVRGLASKQQTLTQRVQQLGGVQIARVTKALNAVVYEVDAARVAEIAALPGVVSINPLRHFEMDLSDTVPAIGATAVQQSGFNGAGVRVAVLDSGIDYTHAALGGAGTKDAYLAAYGTSLTDPKAATRDGLFPTAKVVAGWDFVGDAWPNGPKTTDPDPMDCGAGWTAGCTGGHGTHVADIIGGTLGLAPAADLLAVKVCSSVSTSCNGAAMLEGLDYALDPNGDDDLSDAVDVVNLSLGSSYGQVEEDFSAAAANAVKMGVNVVASAGNSADRPYIVGSPSSAPEVISVAQTQVTSATAIPLTVNSPAGIAGTYGNTATVEWAPIGAGFTGDVLAVGTACPGSTMPAGLSGKVALIDRGVCSVSLKTDTAAKAGAIGVLIANNAHGDAPSFSFGGGDNMVPTLVITQAYGAMIKAALAKGPVNVTVSPASAIPLKGSMASTSSRGPSYLFNTIKPDVGAPGASVSAISGSGTGVGAFGGTSGAAPMVSGAVAQLVQKFRDAPRTPAQIKALLMNTGETKIYTNPATSPGVLAPITRIGGGEIRVDRAAASQSSAWDTDTRIGSLSFGYHSITGGATLKKSVTVRNDATTARTYTIAPSFRYADDAASGAVSFKVPTTITVPAKGTKAFTVMMKIDGSLLPEWTLDGGLQGGNGALLNTVEFDGYVVLTAGAESIHVPWQVLPHKSAAVAPASTQVALTQGAGTLQLSNSGVTSGGVDVFSLTGQSPKIQKFYLPGAGDNFAVIDLKSVGVRQIQGVIQFAVNTFGERAHPNYPALFEVDIDTNRDGVADYIVYNGELGSFASTGQNVVYVQKAGSSSAQAFFYGDADLNSANMILTVPLAAVGLTPESTFSFSVYAADNYFTGNLTDAIENMTYTPAKPRYAADPVTLNVPVGGTASVAVTAVPGGDVASPSQTGLLLLYRDAKAKAEASVITVTP